MKVNPLYVQYALFLRSLAFLLQRQPPQYNVSNIRVPVTLFWGTDDWLADPTDVGLLAFKLQTLAGNYAFQDFNHLDFVW